MTSVSSESISASVEAKTLGDRLPPFKSVRELADAHDKAKVLLTEALERMMSGQPPIYGRTWTTCLKIKRFLSNPNRIRK